jgi:O-acetyl-ADP-ribose deacetylase (regulator of RNase III)
METKSLFKEVKGDLFSVDSNYVIAHCVGNDFIMGRGIAVQFRNKFGNVEYLKKNTKGVGTALYLNSKNYNIFYLITKPYSSKSKPTYSSLKSSLIDMFKQMKEKKLEYLAIPKIGCGLDRLDWDKVKEMINKLNEDYKINIVVYHFPL